MPEETKSSTQKTIRYWWKKRKKTQTDGKIYHVLRLEGVILLKWPYYSKKNFANFANKGLPSQGYVFSSSHVWMWELEYKESWAPKNWCFWTVVLEKTLESPLDCKKIQPVHPKGDQSWVFIGRTDVEAETLANWCEEVTHLKRPWCWERLKVGGEGDDRGWDGWMASPTQWT